MASLACVLWSGTHSFESQASGTDCLMSVPNKGRDSHSQGKSTCTKHARDTHVLLIPRHVSSKFLGEIQHKIDFLKVSSLAFSPLPFNGSKVFLSPRRFHIL